MVGVSEPAQPTPSPISCTFVFLYVCLSFVTQSNFLDHAVQDAVRTNTQKLSSDFRTPDAA
ncbi:hypothetical protein ACRRTK_009401 [Alexandromys fortis]